MQVYTTPTCGVEYIDVAWGGLFIIKVGNWRCLYRDEQNNVPRF